MVNITYVKELTGYSDATIRRMAQAGNIPAFQLRPGSAWRFDKREINRWWKMQRREQWRVSTNTNYLKTGGVVPTEMVKKSESRLEQLLKLKPTNA
ncbi:MAG: hypothetical protein CMF29_08010 [Kiritimatiellaceae bacterium]|nr:hypothetical protein [Kiritimatiellaceae bacterium]